MPEDKTVTFSSRLEAVISKLYPGSIWFKRIAHLCIIYGIGFNFFLGSIQNKIIADLEDRAKIIESMNEAIKDNLPAELEKIEKDSWWETLVDGVSYFVGSPSSSTINDMVDKSNYVTGESKKIAAELIALKQLLHKILNVINITSRLFWIPILWSCIWIYLDFRKGNEPKFIVYSVLLSVPFNAGVYLLLTKFLI